MDCGMNVRDQGWMTVDGCQLSVRATCQAANGVFCGTNRGVGQVVAGSGVRTGYGYGKGCEHEHEQEHEHEHENGK